MPVGATASSSAGTTSDPRRRYSTIWHNQAAASWTRRMPARYGKVPFPSTTAAAYTARNPLPSSREPAPQQQRASARVIIGYKPPASTRNRGSKKRPPYPIASPNIPPIMSATGMLASEPNANARWSARLRVSMMVRTTATGSFSPDSSSSVVPTRLFN